MQSNPKTVSKSLRRRRFNFWSLPIRRSVPHGAKHAFTKFTTILHKSLSSVRKLIKQDYISIWRETAQFFHKSISTIINATMSGKQQVGSHLANAKDGTDLQKPSIIVVALNLMHRFLCLCVRFVVSKVHGEHGPSMAPINDLLLLESATSIAEKIRTKKVSK